MLTILAAVAILFAGIVIGFGIACGLAIGLLAGVEEP